MKIPHAAFFGRSVACARERQACSRAELAAYIGVSAEEMCAIERGETLPNATAMARILCALHMTPDWLFFLNDGATGERVDGIIRLMRCLDAAELDEVEGCLIRLAAKHEAEAAASPGGAGTRERRARKAGGKK